MAENYSLKDELVNESTIKILSDSIKGVYKDFDDIGFQGGYNGWCRPVRA